MSGISKPKLSTWNEIAEVTSRLKSSGKKVVTTNGCFDIIHKGHVSYLFDARALGDALFVGINSDSSVRKIKGPERPINNQESRAFVLGGLACVDGVVVFNETTPVEWLRTVKPDFHVKGGDYKNPENLPEAAALKEWGGKLIILPFVKGFSTSQTIEKIRLP